MSDNEKPDVIEPNYVAFFGTGLPGVLRRAANWVEQNNPTFWADHQRDAQLKMTVVSIVEDDRVVFCGGMFFKSISPKE